MRLDMERVLPVLVVGMDLVLHEDGLHAHLRQKGVQFGLVEAGEAERADESPPGMVLHGPVGCDVVPARMVEEHDVAPA